MPPSDPLARLARAVETSITLVCALILIWHITPEPVRAEVRAQLGSLRREVLRSRRARRERRILESEAWHIGQIVRDYDRSRNAQHFAHALGVHPAHPGPGPEGLG